MDLYTRALTYTHTHTYVRTQSVHLFLFFFLPSVPSDSVSPFFSPISLSPSPYHLTLFLSIVNSGVSMCICTHVSGRIRTHVNAHTYIIFHTHKVGMSLPSFCPPLFCSSFSLSPLTIEPFSESLVLLMLLEILMMIQMPPLECLRVPIIIESAVHTLINTRKNRPVHTK